MFSSKSPVSSNRRLEIESVEMKLQDSFQEWKSSTPIQRESAIRVAYVAAGMFQRMRIKIDSNSHFFDVRRQWAYLVGEFVSDNGEFEFDQLYEPTTTKCGAEIETGYVETVVKNTLWQQIVQFFTTTPQPEPRGCSLCLRDRRNANQMLLQAADVFKSYQHIRQMVDEYENWGGELELELRRGIRLISMSCCARFGIPYRRCFVCTVRVWNNQVDDVNRNDDVDAILEKTYEAIKNGDEAPIDLGKCLSCGTIGTGVLVRKTEIRYPFNAKFSDHLRKLTSMRSWRRKNYLTPHIAYNRFLEKVAVDRARCPLNEEVEEMRKFHVSIGGSIEHQAIEKMSNTMLKVYDRSPTLKRVLGLATARLSEMAPAKKQGVPKNDDVPKIR